MDSTNFVKALKNKSLLDIKNIPKSDLHSHSGRGGSISYIEKMLNVKISPLSEPLNSVKEMDIWFKNNIKCHFPDKDGWIPRKAAAFVQAKADNISVLAMSDGVAEVYWLGSIDIFIAVMNGLHNVFAPETKFLPDLSLCDPNDLSKLDEIFNANWFTGIDINNYSNKMSMSDMKAMCRKAREHNL